MKKVSSMRMLPDEFIPTRHSLLLRLKDWQDHESWQEFFDTYWRLIYGVALRSGLTDQEAQEVVQETVITVARRIPEFRYDPTVCSFKTWLLNLTRWRIIDQVRLRKQGQVREPVTAGGEPDQLPDPAASAFEQAWEEEWEQHLISRAIERVKNRVRPEHYQIFHLSVFKEWPASKIAKELGVSFGKIYLVKHRVGAWLKKEIRALEKQLSS
jgi:RNA polymerase sigma factor (sigma-70 family)